MKVIGHTSGKYAVVNRNNFYDSTILKFYKNLNCSKINLVMPKIFSEHLETHNTFDFEWHGIAAYEKMLALNPVFCVCQNGPSEMLIIIMFCQFAEAVWRLQKFFSAYQMLNTHKI